MARAVQRKAAKDYKEAGIKKGDLYWFAQVKTGPRSSRIIRQLAPIKPQQLTQSEYTSRAYDFADEMQALEEIDTARELAEQIREFGQEQQEKLDNMPEGLQQGSTGELLQERVDRCEEVADEIESICDEWEQAQGDHETEVEEWETEMKSRKQAVEDAEDDEAKEEAEDDLQAHEDEKPEEFDAGEYISRIQELSIE